MSDRVPVDWTLIDRIGEILSIFRSHQGTIKRLLTESRKIRSIQLSRENERNSLNLRIKAIKTEISAVSLRIQDLVYTRKNLVQDAIRIFGNHEFDKLEHTRKMNPSSPDLKKMEYRLRSMHNMNLPPTEPCNGPVSPYVITISNWKYSHPNATVSNRPEDDEPISFGIIQTKKYSPKKLRKILRTASYDDENAVFEYFRSYIEETLRMDIMWAKRKYELWYKLKKLSGQIDFFGVHIRRQESKLATLEHRFESIRVTEIDPTYVATLSKRYNKLEYGIKIADDYAKIGEFARWASDYGRENSSDPDIADAVEWVQLRANEELYLLHNELIGVRNYCDIPYVSRIM